MKKIKEKINEILYSETECCLYWLSILLILFFSVIYIVVYFLADYCGLTFLKMCSMKVIWGIPCPGCGGSRAIFYLFTGQLNLAIYYHAFAVYCAILYIIFFITQTLQRLTKGRITGLKFRNIYWQLGLIILIVQYIAKLCVPGYQI